VVLTGHAHSGPHEELDARLPGHTIDMSKCDSPGHGHSGRNNGAPNSPKIVIYKASRDNAEGHDDAACAELGTAANGLRVLDCFSQQPTLTACDISEMLDISEDDVTQHALRLAGLGYLESDASSGTNAWTLCPKQSGTSR
jgi:hypothetical protein